MTVVVPAADQQVTFLRLGFRATVSLGIGLRGGGFTLGGDALCKWCCTGLD